LSGLLATVSVQSVSADDHTRFLATVPIANKSSIARVAALAARDQRARSPSHATAQPTAIAGPTIAR
jgi:hypothetical protein